MFFILLAISIFILEVKIKNYIEENKDMHAKEEILGGNIILNRYHNKGAMLNIFENKPSFIKALSCVLLGLLVLVFAIILPKDKKTWVKLALSLILGGAASNTYDRIKRGYVVDYFSFKFLKKIIFNISDICIFIGSAILLLAELFNEK
ncbi:MAG: signal peptidase II [Clostridiales bacterium]|nr:signal peptidase II [Clostridiales bacterium]